MLNNTILSCYSRQKYLVKEIQPSHTHIHTHALESFMYEEVKDVTSPFTICSISSPFNLQSSM